LTAPTAARPAGTGAGSLGTFGSLGHRVATDGQGGAIAIWTELDASYTSGDYSAKWRVSVADRAPGSASWSTPQVISAYGAVPTHFLSSQGPDPQLAVALVPGGSAVAAWVQKVDGVLRVQVAGRNGAGAAFSAPTTLPADSSCATLAGFERLELAVDGSGGHLTYVARCTSGYAYRYFVPVSASGAAGTQFSAGPGGINGTVMRIGGSTHAVNIGPYSGYLTDNVVNDSSVVSTSTITTATYPVVSGGTDTQVRSVPSGSRVVSAFRGSHASEVEIGVSVYNGVAEGDVTWFDPAPGSYPYTPAVAASPNGTMAAAWLEDAKVWATVRVPGETTWSTPVVVNDTAGENLVQNSIRVTAADSAVNVLWNTQAPSSGGTAYRIWSAITDPTAAPVAFEEPEETISGALYAGAVALPDGTARVVAPYAGPFLASGWWRDLVVQDGVEPTIPTPPVAGPAGSSPPAAPGKAAPKVRSKITARPTPQAGGTLEVSVGAAVVPTGKVIVTLTKGQKQIRLAGTLKHGTAKVKLPKLPAGSWRITVTYPGDAAVASGGDSLTLKVKSPPRGHRGGQPAARTSETSRAVASAAAVAS
jgi:hypothetical protein